MSSYPHVICPVCGDIIHRPAAAAVRDGILYHYECRPSTTHGELLQMHAAAEATNPTHYKTEYGIECIDAIRAMLGQEGFIAYCRGQILRYNWRLGKKDDSLVETGKAAIYQQWIKDALDGKKLTKDFQ